MSIEHLTEERIQRYLDDKSSGLKNSEKAHLESCERCQGVLSEYRQVYAGLGKEDESLLSPNFAARAMDRIMALKAPATSTDRSAAILGVLGIVSCLVAMWFVVDFKALLNAIVSNSMGSSLAASPVVATLRETTVMLGDSFPFLIFAGLLLIGVAVVDRLLARQRTTRAYFMSV